MRWPQQHSARWPARAASFSLLAQTAPPIGSELEGWAGPCLLDRQYLNQHTLTYDLKQWDFVGAAEAILGSRLGHLHRAPIEAPEFTPQALRRAQIESQIGAVPQDDVELPFWCVVFAQQRDLSMHYEVAFGDRTRHSHQERVDRAAAVWFKLLQDAEERRERRAPAEHGDGARGE